MVFELNARPGLGIQVANQAGLRWRLEKVKGLDIKSVKHGIRVARNIFGGEVEESIEAISGRKVINIKEKIISYNKDTDFSKKEIKKEAVTAFADTGVITSRINSSLASRLGYLQAIKFFNGLEIPKNLKSFSEAQDLIDKYSESIKIIQISKEWLLLQKMIISM